MNGNNYIRNRKRNIKGFTLIELMLSSALLMTVMFAGYYGYNLYSTKWQNRVEYFWQETSHGVMLDAINRLFISTTYYVVQNNQNKESIYFEGSPSTIRFISGSPLLSEGKALVELAIKEAEDKRIILVYREMNLGDKPLFSVEQLKENIQWSNQVTLLNDATKIEWSFYGWASFQDALEETGIVETNQRKNQKVTYKYHDFDTNRVLPERIDLRINRKRGNSAFSIAISRNSIFAVLANSRDDV